MRHGAVRRVPVHAVVQHALAHAVVRRELAGERWRATSHSVLVPLVALRMYLEFEPVVTEADSV